MGEPDFYPENDPDAKREVAEAAIACASFVSAASHPSRALFAKLTILAQSNNGVCLL